MVEQDYIMRIIHEVVRTFLKLVFHIDADKQEEIKFEDSQAEDVYGKLRTMADQGEINEEIGRASCRERV